MSQDRVSPPKLFGCRLADLIPSQSVDEFLQSVDDLAAELYALPLDEAKTRLRALESSDRLLATSAIIKLGQLRYGA